MIARVATFTHLNPDQLDPDAIEHLRETVRAQPGFRAGYHMRDPETGKALSLVVFENLEALRATEAALDERPEGQRVRIVPDSVELFEVIEF